MASKHKYVVP